MYLAFTLRLLIMAKILILTKLKLILTHYRMSIKPESQFVFNEQGWIQSKVKRCILQEIKYSSVIMVGWNVIMSSSHLFPVILMQFNPINIHPSPRKSIVVELGLLTFLRASFPFLRTSVRHRVILNVRPLHTLSSV